MEAEPESRTWPETGDLCTVRYPIFVALSINQDDNGAWRWDLDSGKNVEQGDTCIVVASIRFLWISGSEYERHLIYMLHPDVIGWDDYGNYDVETRPTP